MKIEITQSNYLDALKYFCDELNKILDVNKVTSIVSNGHLCSVLQDNILYSTKINDKIDTKQYFTIGSYYNLDLIVDGFQRWDDSKIFLKYKDDTVVEVEVVDESNSLI